MTLPIFFEAPFFTRKSHIASFFMLLAQCQGVSPACAIAIAEMIVARQNSSPARRAK